MASLPVGHLLPSVSVFAFQFLWRFARAPLSLRRRSEFDQ